MDKLKTPPLIKVSLFAYFNNNLKVFENKSDFYEKIKKIFPTIIYPENKYLRFPMGDVNFYSTEIDKMLQINSNLFAFSDSKYSDFKKFKENFNEYFEQFVKTYNIEQITSFNLNYENSIILKKDIGDKFNDYFTVELNLNGKKDKSFLGSRGNFVFGVTGGLLNIEIAPEISNNITEKYKFSISFLSSFISAVTIDSFFKLVENAHDFIDDIFESSLTENYLKTLK